MHDPHPGDVALAALERVWRGAAGTLDPAARAAHRGGRRPRRRGRAAPDAPVYGVNTGFGKLASVRIAAGDTATLQRNLILSHCAGVGDPTARARSSA